MVGTEEQLEIYFAHAIVDYNTEYEDLYIKTINQFYNNCIIHNPKDINEVIDKKTPEIGRFKLYFFPIIDTCDIVIAAPVFNDDRRRGKFLSGTTREMIYAIKNNKSVIAIIDNELKEIKRDFFTDIQWDVFG